MPDANKEILLRANGKLLLTAEYFVLDGALALGLPVRLGQQLKVSPHSSQAQLHWKSYDEDQRIWMDTVFQLPDVDILKTTDEDVALRLQSILQQACNQNPQFLSGEGGLSVETRLEFPRNWGLGSSSTLLACVAQWAEIDAYTLLEKTMGGSAYDLACAVHHQPILYHREEGHPKVALSTFNPDFKDQLYFVYLGRKQNSREGVKRFRQMTKSISKQKELISSITKQIEKCTTLDEFEQLLIIHEETISECLSLNRVKDIYFSDYWGVVKSLGAWGGDFILATSREGVEKTKAYFNEKGLSVVLNYTTLIL